jgi:hypothetical protein
MIKHNTVGVKVGSTSSLQATISSNNKISITTWSNDVGYPQCTLTIEQAQEFAKKLLKLTKHEYTEPEQIILNAYSV